MHNRQAPIQEERSKALGKMTLASSLALLLIASLTAFQFYSRYRLQSDQLSQDQMSPTKDSEAVLKEDKTVVTWGSVTHGGDSFSEHSQLQQVQAIYATSGLFSALKPDGSVVTWGARSDERDLHLAHHQLLQWV